MEEKKLTFEQALKRLEQVVATLEKGEAPLDEALALFQEGTEMCKTCRDILDQAEQTIEKLELPAEEQSDDL